jgi:hypothetical protein
VLRRRSVARVPHRNAPPSPPAPPSRRCRTGTAS